MSVLLQPDEDGGIQEVVEVLTISRHRTWEAASSRLKRRAKGELFEWGDTGWVSRGALEYSEANPGKPILVALIEPI